MNAPAPTALILLAHGSQDPEWRRPFEQLAEALQSQRPHSPIACAYLSLCKPSLEDCVAQLLAQEVRHIRMAPLFLGAGQHIKQDLPQRQQALMAQYPEAVFELLPILGENATVLAFLTQLLLQELPTP